MKGRTDMSLIITSGSACILFVCFLFGTQKSIFPSLARKISFLAAISFLFFATLWIRVGIYRAFKKKKVFFFIISKRRDKHMFKIDRLNSFLIIDFRLNFTSFY